MGNSLCQDCLKPNNNGNNATNDSNPVTKKKDIGTNKNDDDDVQDKSAKDGNKVITDPVITTTDKDNDKINDNSAKTDPVVITDKQNVDPDISDNQKINTNDTVTPAVKNSDISDQSTTPPAGIIIGDNNKAMLLDDIKQATDNNRIYEFKDFQKEIKLLKIIGPGSFGQVYKAKWDSHQVAVKIFNVINNPFDNNDNTLIDDAMYKELYAEIILATSIPYHPNLVRIMGFCRNPVSVIMEYMSGGSVKNVVYGLTNKPEPSVTEKLIILLKSSSGLKELTTHGLHHRDIGARNILLGDYNVQITIDTFVKITDYGMTRKNDAGPSKWMAPESIQKSEYNEKPDVYMFGITMWEILYGREPFENVDAINAAMRVCMENERPKFLWDLPDDLKTLIQKCWSSNPDDRCTSKEVFKQLNDIKRSHQEKQLKLKNKYDIDIDNTSNGTSRGSKKARKQNETQQIGSEPDTAKAKQNT